MVQYIPPPDPRSLLPPLLACLPTAFVSPRPPPTLLELLSPVLRQRVQLLAASSSPSSSSSWLPLLCWNPESAQDLVDLVSESDAFELHPISGEIEIGNIDPIRYRRLDEETLQARIAAPETGLTIIVLWCETDTEGGSSAWKIAEVKPLDDGENVRSGLWCSSMTDAEEHAHQKVFEEAIREDEAPSDSIPALNGTTANDDSDYWAQYDNTPARTPGADQSPLPAPTEDQIRYSRTTSEAEYFQRYSQVQPEMDNDDPSENKEAIGESTLNGNAVVRPEGATVPQPALDDSLSSNASGGDPQRTLSHPTAAPQTSRPAAVSRLEEEADVLSAPNPSVNHHVSTSIKSLFRLCRANGMERTEFEDLVRTELQTLSMIDDEGGG